MRNWYNSHKDGIDHFFFNLIHLVFYPCFAWVLLCYKHGSDVVNSNELLIDFVFAFFFISHWATDSLNYDIYCLRKRVELLEHEVDVLNGDLPF